MKLTKEIADLIVLVSSKYLDIPEVLDADSVIFYPKKSSGTVSGVSLLVPMSPTFGEPVAFVSIIAILISTHCAMKVKSKF